VPWHASSILLHALVTWLGFVLLRGSGLARPTAVAIGLVFAVHPAHCETVAWISGSPDLLLAASLLGSMWFVTRLANGSAPNRIWLIGHWAAAMLLYVFAQGAKEVAIFYPVLVGLLVTMSSPDGAPARARFWRGIRFAAPFLVVAVVYLIARQAVIGETTRTVWGEGSALATVLSWPMIGAFYLRQIVFPFWIGPSYPLRPLSPGTVGVWNFLLPLVLCLASGVWALREAGRSGRARFALALFVLLLAPTLNIRAFIPEQIVHDRYLYLSLLGFLMLLVPAAMRPVERWLGARGLWYGCAVVAACCIPLAVQTVRYNSAWTTNLALWEWGVKSDRTSAFNHNQLGVYLIKAGRNEEALEVLDRAIAIYPDFPNPHLGRADALYGLMRYDEARASLRTALEVTADRPGTFERSQIYRRLARTFEAERRFTDAVGVLVEGRTELPDRRAALTRDIAILLYQAGQRNAALRELESARDQAAVETSPEARLVLFQLGLLYAGLGRPDDARAVWLEYLDATATLSDPQTLKAREQIRGAMDSAP
jgi:tetratricopeptide (TPR) repeat protein